MTTVNKSALVPYSAHEMYALVTDVESYPRFLPWCGGARVLSREGDLIVASIDIAYKGVHKTFTTRNRAHQDKMLEMRLVEGPFKRLHGHWQFHRLDADACKVTLDLEFEFSNKLIAIAIGPVFHAIATSLVDSFRQQAVAVYGPRS